MVQTEFDAYEAAVKASTVDTSTVDTTGDKLINAISEIPFVKLSKQLAQNQNPQTDSSVSKETYKIFERQYMFQKIWYVLIMIGLLISIMILIRFMKNNQ